MLLAIVIRSNGVVEEKSVVVALFNERVPSNTLSAKLPCHQLRLKKRCTKPISEAIREQ
jgi:hypothetical protein